MQTNTRIESTAARRSIATADTQVAGTALVFAAGAVKVEVSTDQITALDIEADRAWASALFCAAGEALSSGDSDTASTLLDAASNMNHRHASALRDA